MTNDQLDREGARLPEGVVDLRAERERREDHIVRGTAADGMVRAFAITARATVEEARARHDTTPVATAALGRLLMGAQMMGAMSKDEDELITLVMSGDGPIGGLTVTANNKGQVKGYANHPNVWLDLKGDNHLDVGGGIGAGTLTVVRDLPGVEPYSSTVPLATGAICAGASDAQVGALRAFGMKAGLAFQLQDDLLNLVGDPARQGKDFRSDVTEGKRTLLAVWALTHLAEGPAAELRRILSSNTTDEAQLARAVELMDESGAIDHTRAYARRLADEAKSHLASADFLPEAGRTLLSMADFFVERLG